MIVPSKFRWLHAGVYLCIALPLALAGCARYRPQPIDAATSAHSLAHRSLDDPRLRHFLVTMNARDSAPFGLRALTLVAVYERPDLQIARAQYAIARGGLVSARALPNPVLGIEPTYNATQPLPSPIEIGPIVRFLIGSLGARQAGIAAARDQAVAARSLISEAARVERGHVRTALLALWSAEHRARTARREAKLTADARDLIIERQTSGMVSEAVVANATEKADTAALAAADAASAVSADRARLAGSIGMPVAALQGVRLSFAAFRHPAEPRALAPLVRHALTHRPDILAALARYDGAEARLRQAIDEQFPGITIGPGYHYDQGDNKFILAISLPLPVLNQNQGPIAEARARRRLAAAKFDQTQQTSLAAIDTAWADWHASRKITAAANELARTAQHQLAAARTDFAAGASDRLTLIEAERRATRTEAHAFAAHARTLAALGQLADTTDHPMFDTEAR